MNWILLAIRSIQGAVWANSDENKQNVEIITDMLSYGYDPRNDEDVAKYKKYKGVK